MLRLSSIGTTRKGSTRERTDLGADRAQSRAVGRPPPSLLPALVERRPDRLRARALLGPVPPRGRRDRDAQRGGRGVPARAAGASPPRRRGTWPRAPVG